MNEDQARALLRGDKASGPDRGEAEHMCFGDCCLRPEEREALLTLIYGEEGP
jgi:hypothetical protein